MGLAKDILIATFIFSTMSCSSFKNNDAQQISMLSKSERQTLIELNEQTFDIFKELSNTAPNENTLLSPLSLIGSVAMYINTLPNSATIPPFFSDGNNLTNTNSICHKINSVLTNSDSLIIFHAAQSLWLSEDCNISQNTLDSIGDIFNAPIIKCDLSSETTMNRINKWGMENTNGMIPMFLSSPLQESVTRFSANALFFQGMWTTGFNPAYNKDDHFYSTPTSYQNITFMSHISEQFEYYESPELQAVRLPYGNGNYGMTILLPRVPKDINDMINDLTITHVDSIRKNMVLSKLNLYMPRFECSTNVIAPKTLSNHIRIQQDATIKVDENGTIIAVITSTDDLSETPKPSDTKQMKINHPFLFMVDEKKSGSILLIGKIYHITTPKINYSM